jgi:hypothetical protein
MIYRDELTAYRDRLIVLQSEAPDARAASHAALAIGIVGRWLQHADADQIWNEVTASVPAGFTLEVGALARTVIQYRLWVERLSEHLAKSPDREKKMFHRAKRYLAENSAEALAALAFESAVRSNTKRLRATTLRRERAAPRTWFIQQWTTHFKELCGQPLDNVVRFLTAIAFDDPNITLDAIRGASRQSTRAARRAKAHRDTRPPKKRLSVP